LLKQAQKPKTANSEAFSQANKTPRKHSPLKPCTAKNRSRSEYVELHFETLFFSPPKAEEVAAKN